MHYFSRKSRLERRLRSLLIRRAGKLSESDALVAMYAKGGSMSNYYADRHLALHKALGAMDEEIRLTQAELKS